MSEDKKEKYDPKAKRKIRAENYEEKVKFSGSLEDMIKMAGDTKINEKKSEK